MVSRILFGVVVLCLSVVSYVQSEDPYVYLEWTVSYCTRSPLGVPQRVICINDQFPGPTVNVTTNNNVWVTIENKLEEPFLMTWNGIKQRKVSWQDGVLGTNCPIPPNTKWQYQMQMKDQIGTYMYYLSTLMHRAAGGYGAFIIMRRLVIPLPYPQPDQEFSLVVSDFHYEMQELQQILDDGKPFPAPDGLLINGSPSSTIFDMIPGIIYMFRVANLGMTTSINFRIQGHMLRLVEVEGSHTVQEAYESLDIHVGQSVAFLVTAHTIGEQQAFSVVASSRFMKPVLTATAVVRHQGSNGTPSGLLPLAPTYQIQFILFRWNLTANAARPNPQGSYHYGTIPITRTIVLENTVANISGKTRYAVNKVSFVNPDTPLKLADYYNIPGVFSLNSIPDLPPPGPAVLGTSVINNTLHDYVEIIFQNTEPTMQAWHLDGNDFWPVLKISRFGSGRWNETLRRRFYNFNDAATRCTVQVYPYSWSAILVSLDNKGMWNLRSANWPRRYLGQELYLRVWNNEKNQYTESDIPANALHCGRAAHLQ